MISPLFSMFCVLFLTVVFFVCVVLDPAFHIERSLRNPSSQHHGLSFSLSTIDSCAVF